TNSEVLPLETYAPCSGPTWTTLRSLKRLQISSLFCAYFAKYARAERELKPARVYGVGALALYEKAEIKAPEDKKKYLIVGVSSDRGLCGAIHSSVAKNIKAQIANLTVVGVGDKLRTLLQRTHGKNFLFNFKEIGRKPPTFGDASIIALELLNSGYEFDEGSVIYNRFRSVISYRTEEKPIYSLETVSGSENVSVYDDIDADVLQNYQEFTLANIIFYSLKESTTSEQSVRMLTLTFNRTRQAVITKELIEIISGAELRANQKVSFKQSSTGKEKLFWQSKVFCSFNSSAWSESFAHGVNWTLLDSAILVNRGVNSGP
uniref:F-ATPase gamma subunit n=1 Tax=Anolis carolinensis TaxID=28377 RepID=A0A803TV87_ANOCA